MSTTAARPSNLSEWNSNLSPERPSENRSEAGDFQSESTDLWKSWEADSQTEALDLKQSVNARNAAPQVEESPSPGEELGSGGQLRSDIEVEIPWPAELALAERRAEREGTVDFQNAFNKQELLKKKTREFMSKLRRSFKQQIELFNDSRKAPGHAIQIYRVSQTADDFMLFRNGVKLIVSGQRAGQVLFAYNQFLGQIFAPNKNPTLTLEAHWGPFNELFWQYRGERIEIADLVRHFLTEFSHQSFR